MKESNVNKLRELVNVSFYYKGETLDSTIMEKLDDNGQFTDGFLNAKFEGAPYGFEIAKGCKVQLNTKSYIVKEVRFAYFNQDNGVFPLYIKVFLEDEQY